MDTLSHEWLDYQADHIEALLASHKIEAVVTDVQISPRWVRFALQLGLGVKITAVQNLTEEIALALAAPSVRITRAGGVLAIEVGLSSPQPIYLLALARDIPVLPPVTAVLGLNLEGETYTLPLMAPEVTHVLIAGTTGCGKTELLRTLLLSLALYNRQAHLQIALIDPKKRGFAPLEGLPHLVAPIATTPDDARSLLDYLVGEMERRDRENAPATPRVIIAVDEVGDLLSISDKEVERSLVRLAQRGREAGFHIVCSTQRPSAEAVPSALKANLPARLVGKVASGQEALTATGIAGTNAETLTGSGDFVAVIGGQLTRFQAAYTGSLDIRYIQRQLEMPASSNEHDRSIPLPEIGEDYSAIYDEQGDSGQDSQA
ncbi:MAG: DNA translocase FtsK [Anaerolineae bacterium]|nr:DNA translocase FtsK [Anaerolineae bacterium]